MRGVAAFVFVFVLTCCTAQAQSLPGADVPGQAAPRQQTFRMIVRDLGRNFRDLPSVQTGVILVIGGGLAAVVHGEDSETTAHWTHSGLLGEVFEGGATLGGVWVQFGGAVGTYALSRAVGSPRTALLGADLLRGQIVNTVLTQGIKVAVNRQRPDGSHLSFPSGHTSSTFTTATVLERRFGWKIGVPAYAAAAFVGGSRLQENQHYLSDVLFGAAIGIVSGRAASLGNGSATFAMSPIVAPATVGLAFTRRTRP